MSKILNVKRIFFFLRLSFQGQMVLQRGRIENYMRGFSFIDNCAINEDYNEYINSEIVHKLFHNNIKCYCNSNTRQII